MCIVRERRPAGFLDMKCQTSSSLITSCFEIVIASKAPDTKIFEFSNRRRQMGKTDCLTPLAHTQCRVVSFMAVETGREAGREAILYCTHWAIIHITCIATSQKGAPIPSKIVVQCMGVLPSLYTHEAYSCSQPTPSFYWL